MSGVKKTVQLYQKLFSLPSNYGLIVLSAVGIIFLVIERFLLYGVFWPSGLFFSGTLYVGVLLSMIGFSRCRALTPRRISGLTAISLFVVILTDVISFIGLILLQIPVHLQYTGISLGMMLFFINIIASSMSTRRVSHVLMTLLIISGLYLGLSWFLDGTLYYQTNGIWTMIAIPLFFGIASGGFLWILNSPANSVLGVGGIKLFQGFVDEWLEGNSEILDDIFTSLGIEQRVHVRSLECVTKESNTYIVIPEIHPGPFKTIGSSSLSNILRDHFTDHLFITHGPSTHDLNLVSKKETHRIAELLEQNLKQPSSESITLCSPFLTNNYDSISLMGQIFGEIGLFFISSNNNNLDDIDRSVAIRCREIGTRYGLTDVILIDSHNGVADLCDPLMPFSTESDDLYQAVEGIIQEGFSLSKETFSVGVSHLFPPPFSVQEGFGPAGLSTIIVKRGNEKTCYMSIDGNNLVVGLREKLVSAIKQASSVDHVVIITTDTHMVSGLDTKGMGFNPLGEKVDHDKIISVAVDLVTKAMTQLNSASMNYRVLEVSDAKVLGRENMDAFTTLISGSASLAKSSAVSLLILLILLNLLSLIF